MKNNNNNIINTPNNCNIGNLNNLNNYSSEKIKKIEESHFHKLKDADKQNDIGKQIELLKSLSKFKKELGNAKKILQNDNQQDIEKIKYIIDNDNLSSERKEQLKKILYKIINEQDKETNKNLLATELDLDISEAENSLQENKTLFNDDRKKILNSLLSNIKDSELEQEKKLYTLLLIKELGGDLSLSNEIGIWDKNECKNIFRLVRNMICHYSDKEKEYIEKNKDKDTDLISINGRRYKFHDLLNAATYKDIDNIDHIINATMLVTLDFNQAQPRIYYGYDNLKEEIDKLHEKYNENYNLVASLKEDNKQELFNLLVNSIIVSQLRTYGVTIDLINTAERKIPKGTAYSKEHNKIKDAKEEFIKIKKLDHGSILQCFENQDLLDQVPKLEQVIKDIKSILDNEKIQTEINLQYENSIFNLNNIVGTKGFLRDIEFDKEFGESENDKKLREENKENSTERKYKTVRELIDYVYNKGFSQDKDQDKEYEQDEFKAFINKIIKYIDGAAEKKEKTSKRIILEKFNKVISDTETGREQIKDTDNKNQIAKIEKAIYSETAGFTKLCSDNKEQEVKEFITNALNNIKEIKAKLETLLKNIDNKVSLEDDDKNLLNIFINEKPLMDTEIKFYSRADDKETPAKVPDEEITKFHSEGAYRMSNKSLKNRFDLYDNEYIVENKDRKDEDTEPNFFRNKYNHLRKSISPEEIRNKSCKKEFVKE